MSSAPVARLQRRVSELRHALLPPVFDPTVAPSADDQERIRAFQVLAHAELEDCLETLASEVALTSVAKWRVHGRPRRVVFALLVSFRAEHFFEHWDSRTRPGLAGPNTQRPTTDMQTAVDAALKRFRDEIDNNHGIRRTNVLKLMRPLGLRASDLGAAWLSTLDSFGDRRGAAAHKSSTRLTKLLDARSEYDTVVGAVNGMADLDRLLIRLRQGA